MPILSGLWAATTAEAPPSPESSPVLLPEVGFATATYYAPDGTAWPLTDDQAGWFTLAEGVSGLGAASVALVTDDHPRGGARLRHAQPQPRTVIWPLYVYGDTHLEFLGRWRALTSAFTRTLRRNPDGTRTPGTLEIARPDGTRRHIRCFYSEGFEGQGKQGTGITSDAAVLSLFCEDPYWYDPNPIAEHREFAAAATVNYLSPYPSVSSSQSLGATTLVNPGDVMAWPTWQITGPASSFVITNVDSGEAFTLNPNAPGIAHGNLLAGQQVLLTTDPPTVRYQDGTNWMAALDWPGATLWGLPPGETNVSFVLNGAAAGSAVDLFFYARYEMA